MTANKIISFVSRAGSVILTTVMSFVILPPAIEADGNEGVNWKNVFAFCAGILSIIIYDRYKNKPKLRKIVFGLITGLLLLIISYQTIYIQYSITCYDKVRLITPHGGMKPEAMPKYDYWKTHSPRPLQSLLEANSCSSTQIWEMSAIFLPYYGMILIYFGIIVTTVLLLTSVSDAIQDK